VHTIVRLESHLAAQSCFLVAGRLDMPRLFLLESAAGSYQVTGEYSGPTLTWAYFLRQVYAENPSAPPELLACLDLDWFLSPPAPTLSAAASLFKGKLAYEQEGEIWILGQPGYQEPIRSATEAFAPFAEPRLSPSGEWLAIRLKDETGARNSESRLILKVAFGASKYEETLPVGSFAWAPDQDRLAYVTGEGELRVVGVDQKPTVLLVPRAENRRISGFAWSPDGAWIAYKVVERREPNTSYHEIWKAPVEGGKPVELYQGTAILAGWTSDSKKILFWGRDASRPDPLLADGAPLMAVPAGAAMPRFWSRICWHIRISWLPILLGVAGWRS